MCFYFARTARLFVRVADYWPGKEEKENERQIEFY
jgi:hypothetical protein